MRRLRMIAVAALCALIALAPSLADARAGGGRSYGSYGSRSSGGMSYSTPRQATPQYNQPSYRASPVPTRPMPSFGTVHPFWSGMMGGLIGAGLGGMLFGHGYPIGASPLGVGFGLLLQLALLGLLAYGAIRLFRRR
jgi:hypothetical protein